MPYHHSLPDHLPGRLPARRPRRHGWLHAAAGACPNIERQQDNGLDIQARRPCSFLHKPGRQHLTGRGVAYETLAALAEMDHPVALVTGYDRKLFGRCQIVLKSRDGFYVGDSDPRADGWVFGL